MPTKQTEQGGFVWVEEKGAPPRPTAPYLLLCHARATEAAAQATKDFVRFIKARLSELIPTVRWEARPISEEIRPGSDDIWLACTLNDEDVSEMAVTARCLAQYRKKVFAFGLVEVEAWLDYSDGTTRMCIYAGALDEAADLAEKYGLDVDWRGLDLALDTLDGKVRVWKALLDRVQGLVRGGSDVVAEGQARLNGGDKE